MEQRISDRMKTMNPSAVREIFKFLSIPGMISFAGGNPSELTFPAKELAEISARMYENSSSVFLQYGISEGYGPLRELTKERMAKKYNVGTEDDDVLIVTGGQQVIDLAHKCLVNEGDTVISETPSFIGGLNVIRSYKTNLVGVRMDNGGMDIDELEAVLKREKNVKLLYTIPTFQNPMGVTMTVERRKRLYELAVEYDFIILEDNPYFEMHYSGDEMPCIKSFDRTGHVIYCGSYSKTVSPGLRVGYLIANKSMIQKLTVAKQCADVHTPVYTQMLVAEYMLNYDMDEHIVECRNIYRAQRDRMIAGLDRHLDKRIPFTRPDGGLFIWMSLPERYSGYDLFEALIQRKVATVPGSTFDPRENRDYPGLRLNFSMPTMEQIDTGTAILGECVSEFLK